MPPINRRAFLQHTAVAGVAAGALWAAPAVTGWSTAFAGESCVFPVDESAWSGWSRSGSGGTGTTLTKTYAAVSDKPALTVTLKVTATDGSIDGSNLSVSSDPYSYTGGTVPHVLIKGKPNGGVFGSAGVRGYVEVELTFSAGVTNLLFDVENIAGFGLAGTYRRWQIWLSGATNTTLPPGYTFSPNGVGGAGTNASRWAREDRSYGSVAVDMPGSNATPITELKFHFDMHRAALDSAPGVMDAGLANLKFCR